MAAKALFAAWFTMMRFLGLGLSHWIVYHPVNTSGMGRGSSCVEARCRSGVKMNRQYLYGTEFTVMTRPHRLAKPVQHHKARATPCGTTPRPTGLVPIQGTTCSGKANAMRLRIATPGRPSLQLNLTRVVRLLNLT